MIVHRPAIMGDENQVLLLRASQHEIVAEISYSGFVGGEKYTVRALSLYALHDGCLEILVGEKAWRLL